MSYPKPLSEKSLAKMYREANIDERKSVFLHKLFLASANLYGVVVLRDLWEILKEIANQYGMEELKRKDLIAFSSIARREDLPYYIYEIDELYSEEKRTDLSREIVHKSLIKSGFGKNAWYYDLVETQSNKPYFIPQDLLSFAVPDTTREEAELLSFLKGLKVTAKEAEDSYGRKFTCNHTGEFLGDFSFRNSDENYEYKLFSGEYKDHPSKNEKALQELVERTGCSEAEKIFRMYKQNCNIGDRNPSYSTQRVLEELNEVGVQLSAKQFGKLTELLMQFNNNSNLWCNRGWTPNELAKCTPRMAPTSVSLGPGIKQAIADGKINREDLESELTKRGIVLAK